MNRLIDAGEKLGLKGEDLAAFVSQQQAKNANSNARSASIKKKHEEPVRKKMSVEKKHGEDTRSTRIRG